MPSKIRTIRLAPLALADLENIWAYTTERWSQDQAESYHADIVAALEGLSTATKMGRPVDVWPGYLKYAVGSHVVFYRQTEANIEVIRILHQSMDTGKHL